MEYLFYWPGDRQVEIPTNIGISNSLGAIGVFLENGVYVERKVIDTSELSQSELDAVSQVLVDNGINDVNWKTFTKVIVG